MEWIPAFKLGLWNAWILMLIYLLQPYLLMLVDKAVGQGDVLKKMGSVPTDPREKRLNLVFMAILWVMLAYSFFLPLKLGTPWLYTGLAVYLTGLAILLSTMVTAARAKQGQLFTGGMYRISRHPMYLAQLMLYVGAGIASASWIFLVLAATLVGIMHEQVEIEEKECVEQFGTGYQEYMRVTPKWLGVPKVKGLEQV
ncbi:MAG TPA: isoprenylcysteine carboxylmethyltransferase family protein [Bellilinea sp.]